MDTVRAGDVGIGNGVLSRYLDEAFVDAQIVHSRLEAVRQRGLQYSRFAWLAPIFCCPHGAAVRVEPNNENFFRREQTARHLAKVPSFITLELSSASRTSRRVADVGIVCLQWKCVSVKTVFTGHCPSSKQASKQMREATSYPDDNFRIIESLFDAQQCGCLPRDGNSSTTPPIHQQKITSSSPYVDRARSKTPGYRADQHVALRNIRVPRSCIPYSAQQRSGRVLKSRVWVAQAHQNTASQDENSQQLQCRALQRIPPTRIVSRFLDLPHPQLSVWPDGNTGGGEFQQKE